MGGGQVSSCAALSRTRSCCCSGVSAKTLAIRAKSFKTDISAYSAMRKMAQGVFAGMVDRAESEFLRARKSEIPGKAHSVVTPSTFHGRTAIGTYVQPALAASSEISDDHLAPIDTHGIGMADRLGWDDRREYVHGPVLTLRGDNRPRGGFFCP